MPEIRIYLLTYRRPRLLIRALRSLLAQTHRDWICELHNDAPDDDEPRRVLAQLAGDDPRFIYCPHARNLGPVATFNLAFGPVEEPFISVLEDDNWWEPALLETLLGHLKKDPTLAVAWANLRIHEELTDKTWRDTGTTVWPIGHCAHIFERPVLLQAFDALHSNGAMLCRTGKHQPVPNDCPFAHIEAARERTFAGLLLLDPTPLANFAVTLETSRASHRLTWLIGQLHLTGSFLNNVSLTSAAWDELWHYLRSSPRNTNLLLLLAFAGIKPAAILRRSRPADWLFFIASFVRRPSLLLASLKFSKNQPALWHWLNVQTGRWIREAQSRGFSAIPAHSPVKKSSLMPLALETAQQPTGLCGPESRHQLL